MGRSRAIGWKVLIWAIMGFSVGIFTCTPLALYQAINPNAIIVSLLVSAASSAIISASAFFARVVDLSESQRLGLWAIAAINALSCMFVCGWNCNSKFGGVYAAASFAASALIIALSQKAYFVLKANQ